MNGSWTLGSLFGIPVRIHFTFPLLLGGWALFELLGSGPAAALATTVLIVSVFGFVVMHEFGHALMARRFGIATRDVTLLPIGGVARLERMPRDPAQELAIAVAGPAVNVALAGLFGALFALSGSTFVFRMMAINLGLALFNMLPAFPMDGGRVLRALLAGRMSHLRATRIAARVGRVMAVAFGVAGLFGNPMLIFIAIFVWFGAGQEVALTRWASQAALLHSAALIEVVPSTHADRAAQ